MTAGRWGRDLESGSWNLDLGIFPLSLSEPDGGAGTWNLDLGISRSRFLIWQPDSGGGTWNLDLGISSEFGIPVR